MTTALQPEYGRCTPKGHLPIGWTGEVYCENCGELLYSATDVELVLEFGWRVVKNKVRARRLRQRGEQIEWSDNLTAWLWLPEDPPLDDYLAVPF